MSMSSGRGSPADRIRRAWVQSADTPVDLAAFLAELTEPERADAAEVIVADAQERWDRGLIATLEHYRRVVPELAGDEEIVRAILMLEASQRRAEVGEAVSLDLKRRFPELAEEIEGITELVSLMNVAGLEAQSDIEEERKPGDVLGTYRLVEWLGAGSFGEVWNAWDTTLERYVALKVLNLPAASDDGLDRVLSEAQAAAALDHENIVKVHAAGKLAGGTCFIDCQLVGDPDPVPEDRKRVRVGKTLAAVLNGDKKSPEPMNPRWAAKLMRAVCRGVSAAHARGIVHRDIKPSNILVTESGRPMVTDFGLSIAAPMGIDAGDGPATTTVSMRTRGGRITGTPAFMSPEQAEGKPAQPASDVYALGATLRFLLTGKLPLDASGKYHADARWDVVEQIRRRELEPLMSTSPDLPRELAAICDKAMSFLPQDRYPSAQHMADDLAAWIGHLPVSAIGAGPGRRTVLWVKRNPAVATVLGVSLLVGVAGSWRYVVSINRALTRAISAEEATRTQLTETERARAESESVNSFLQNVLAAADPNLLGPNVTVLDAVEFSAEEISTRFRSQPRIEAKVRATMGMTYRMLGRISEAKAQLEDALAIQERELGGDHRDTLWTRHALLMAKFAEGQFAGGTQEIRTLLADMTRALGADDSLTLACRLTLGMHLTQEHLFGEAEVHLRSLLEAKARGAEPDIANVMKAKVELARNMFFLGKQDESLRLLKESIDEQGLVFGNDHVLRLNTLVLYAVHLAGVQKHAEAEPLLREAYDGFARKLSAGHPQVLMAARDLASVMGILKKPADALAFFEPIFKAYLAQPEAELIQVPRSHEILGMLYFENGRYEDAERSLLEARAGFVDFTGGENNAVVRRIDQRLSQVYGAMGDAQREEAFRGRTGDAPQPEKPK
jgi:serine/threonine protein kinase/tetratricopeptide (TPR) repeat protein